MITPELELEQLGGAHTQYRESSAWLGPSLLPLAAGAAGVGAGFGEVDIELLGTQEETLLGLIVRCDGNCSSREVSPEERMRTAPDQLRFLPRARLPARHWFLREGQSHRSSREEMERTSCTLHYFPTPLT